MPDIKLTRTDTTHDLSQKAEKRYQRQFSLCSFRVQYNDQDAVFQYFCNLTELFSFNFRFFGVIGWHWRFSFQQDHPNVDIIKIGGKIKLFDNFLIAGIS